MMDVLIALVLQLGLLLLLGRFVPGGGKESAAPLRWPAPTPFEPTWETVRRMIEREYGACSPCGGCDDEE
jgi:hypothetical protein